MESSESNTSIAPVVSTESYSLPVLDAAGIFGPFAKISAETGRIMEPFAKISAETSRTMDTLTALSTTAFFPSTEKMTLVSARTADVLANNRTMNVLKWNRFMMILIRDGRRSTDINFDFRTRTHSIWTSR